MIPLTDFPAINATLNGITSIFLLAGYIFIRRGNTPAHRACMLSAFTTSAVFLACYLTYHFGMQYYYGKGVTRFTTPGLPRLIYLTILGTHTVLAVVVLPLILRTLYLAIRQRFDEHKRLARWTWPVWMYVSVTGVVVYWMLYHLYPSAPPAITASF